MSSSAIQKVVQSARRTFSRKFERFVLDSDDFASSLCELKTALDGLRAKDVGLEVSQAIRSIGPNIAPVTYIKIHEDQDVSIGIFVVKEGQKHWKKMFSTLNPKQPVCGLDISEPPHHIIPPSQLNF